MKMEQVSFLVLAFYIRELHVLHGICYMYCGGE